MIGFADLAWFFYHQDHYPDDHVFAEGEWLRLRFQPDFLVIHSMNIDDAGHQHGADSQAYRRQARAADGLLSWYMPTWLAQGYQILVTSDHGMHADGMHGGPLEAERAVPLFIVGRCPIRPS